ncbi:DUF7847 domain-containing protein [Streptomyces tsukubensis]|uniref:DUF7847 domain-containing protein n=1 Tax=Streptomyces tsukubensis TaxID=83656 RepID=A0A1V4A0M3_9ACTN|nr:glycerophosphoryl diester phosphodiesterase membrane domain-containing protein [Streptomyces tsukubensis]OON72127.1 hypothetical protein B1H18_31095 [Streptomyces tsukubensis]QFR93931.1 hypothetical protein GBW32_13740 [Streptomyces tsukubensis]
MNDTPGWASPGSAPSDGKDQGTPEPAEPADQPHGPDTKWSKEQPPPGQWSAPGSTSPGQNPPPQPPPPGNGGPGGGGGPGGWGGGPAPRPGGGWGGGWGAPPAAAKPGVIPLRPLGVGEILDGAVSTMRAHWRTVLGISLGVAVVTQIVAVLVQGFLLDTGAGADVLSDPSASLDELSRAMGDTLLGSGVIQLITLLGTLVATALLTMVTSRAVLGRSAAIGEAWQDSRPQLLRLLGLTLLVPLICLAIVAVCTLPGILVAVAGSTDAGAALALLGGLVGAVLALWLLIRFSLASPALMLEKQGVFKSMSRSAKLVRGSWWRVLGIQLLATIIAAVVTSIISIPFTLIAAAFSGDNFSSFVDAASDVGWAFLIISAVGSVIAATITFPITAGVTVLLYIDQRIRREALDLELVRAAGLDGQGPGGPLGG